MVLLHGFLGFVSSLVIPSNFLKRSIGAFDNNNSPTILCNSSNKQAHFCKDCKHKFVPSLLKKVKYSPETVSLYLDLYFSGMSPRKIARTLNNHLDMKIGQASIYRWIQKYIPKISEYVNSLSTQLSETWHMDELFVHMKDGLSYKRKDMAFVWNVMDRKTRFLLASKLLANRDKDCMIKSMKEALANAHGKEPETIYTDSYKPYKHGMSEILPNTKHFANSGINKPHCTNNRIES